MIVVSDTSPLNYLVLLDVVDVLPALFGEVIIPPAVLAELTRAQTPDAVRSWALNPPEWLRVVSPEAMLSDLDVDPGEAEAISIAVTVKADLLLIDDRKGRLAAHQHGLTTIGTLTVLESAAQRNLVSLTAVIEQLRSTNFRASSAMLDNVLRREAERDKPSS